MSKVPRSWRQYLESTSLENFHCMLNSSFVDQTCVYPLSLICLKSIIKYFSLPRKLIKRRNIPSDFWQKNKLDLQNYESHLFIKEFPIYNEPKMWNSFFKHVKPKKRHEIFNMAKVTAEIAEKLNIHTIIDIGSGLGHLSRILAYGYHLNVCSIETQHQLTQKAKKLDQEFEKIATKYFNNQDLKYLMEKRPIHLNQTINFNLEVSDFLQNLKSAFSTEKNHFHFGIVGLHPCGDLASILLELYCKCPEAKFISIVGCCYHKLTTSITPRIKAGFPLTRFCAEKYIDISYEARALACHAVEIYSKRLQSSNYNHLKVHCYRAALEKIIQKNWPELRKSGLANVKVTKGLDFKQYSQLALKKLTVTVSEEDLNSKETLQNLSDWRDVVKYYSLRLMMAPLIETVILLDRKLYLLEKGIPSEIIIAFDPEISPRNQLLLSEKQL